ncbi:shikimate kinase [Jannaschia sp. S6380]|uniref:shikimate kinase n=1 Tax=Jannaschia sp. S6380 TaxID=2926408 RepID=UPI001FF2BAC8|nr:shikimate kinase [Jannaschia sp. S6380]MCK0166823.1 shikimate kinase [Jannaschia sp. S6380]
MRTMGDKMPDGTQLRLARPVVMVGMMGSGKTAVGSALADMLDVPFRDTDAAMVDAARMSIPEIFERDGEAFFRARETEVLRRLLSEGPGILSTGGGAFLRPENRAAISEAGVSVWLKADAELLWNRVRHKTTRPLLMTDDPKGTLLRLLDVRTPHYEKADLVAEADAAASIGQMAGRVITLLAGAEVLR